LARNRHRYGTLQTTVVEDGENDNWLIRLADLIDQGNPVPWSLRTLDKSLSILPRKHIISVTSDTDLTIDDQVVFATGGVTINLVEIFNGMDIYVKNIDTSGTVTINPGTLNIEQSSGSPNTTDITLASLETAHLIFMTDTFWKLN
jgi:hypothetical protein